MIQGVHLLLYSNDPAADRAFLRDVLGWPSVEDPSSGEGWLIFETPPSELGVHPADGVSSVRIHLMCDDVEATVAELAAKGVTTEPVVDAGYGLATAFTLPGGAEVGLYEPRHESPLAHVKR
ncbi:VOC family protein [Nonomuraea sp. NPDC048826]|uniref:VOC family protein n=1 Tax=Nonomuraea sp. NPDC048826 TaxID=3364347 RepID=UPI003711E8CE